MATQRVACFFCDHCKKETHFVNIQRASMIAGVNRSTVYYWLDKDWVHWRELPSGRRVVCQESLSRPGNQNVFIGAEMRVRTKGAAAYNGNS
jgi:hypothetical protein